MSKNTLAEGVENLSPGLIPGASVTKFSDDIYFVQHEDRTAKIDSYESEIVERLDGKTPLCEIIAQNISEGKTEIFDRLIKLISKLGENSLLDERTASLLKSGEKRKVPFVSEITGWQLKKNRSMKMKGKILFSIPSILLLILLAAFSFYQMPTIKGVNILKEFGSGIVPVQFSYLLSILFSAFVLISVLSTVSLSAAADLSARDLPVKIGLRMCFGVFYLHVNSSAIVSAGRKNAVKHFLTLILIPFSIAGIASLVWYNGIFEPAMTIIHTVAFSVGLFALAPFFNSFLLKISGFFIPGQMQVFTFLRKKFIKEILTPGKTTTEVNGLIFLSSAGLIWIFGVYNYFWSVASSTLTYLLADAVNSGAVSNVFIIIALCLIAAPLFFIFAAGAFVFFGNIGSVARTPYVKMNRLAASIASKKVPSKSQIFAFLEKISLFSGLSEPELAELCSHIRLMKFGPGTRIIQQGEKGDAFYTMVAGKADVVIEDSSGNEDVVEELVTGDSFGEIALLEEVPRTAGVVTVTSAAVFEIKKESFTKFVVASAGGMEKVTDQIRLGKLLADISLFKFMTPKQISQIILKLESVEFGKDEVIFEQGDTGDKFYVIQEGSVRINGVEEGKTVVDKTLEKGDFFGEIALIKKVPRTAGAKTLSECRLSALSKEAFLEIFSNSLMGGAELDEVLSERVEQLGKEALKSCG